jgi:regulator of protease activity HflC (stomatin/prohibitin superfamily)
VKIQISGVLYYRVTDAKKAAYGICEPIKAISNLAQTSMRSEIGLLELDRTFQEREHLNTSIKKALNSAGDCWGIEVLRYEIKDIRPPDQIRRSMEL